MGAMHGVVISKPEWKSGSLFLVFILSLVCSPVPRGQLPRSVKWTDGAQRQGSWGGAPGAHGKVVLLFENPATMCVSC